VVAGFALTSDGHLRKPAKTREETGGRDQAGDGICEWPTGLAVSVAPHQDTWKVVMMSDGPKDSDRYDMIETIADRLRTQFDLKG
jgi:hypothetical protein